MAIIGNVGYTAAMTSLVFGMILMSNPEKAKKGNKILIVGMLLAVVSTIVLYSNLEAQIPWKNWLLIIGVLALGTVVGGKITWGYKLTKMPELIALFNGLGGLAAVLIGYSGLIGSTRVEGLEFTLLITSVVLGMVTFSGSLIAFFKLTGKLTKSLSQNRAFMVLCLSFCVLFVFKLAMQSNASEFGMNLIFLSFFSFLLGVFFANNVGGADMPVLISVLNGFTGVITCITGLYFENTIMILLGVFVGFTGLVLTIQMSKAMNRNLIKVFFSSIKTSNHSSEGAESYHNIQEITAATIASELTFVKKVAIIPGFGLATAHAQHACKKLMDRLNEMNIDVKFIVHPVAGRMPGHMNVLLAEANVSYENTLELDQGNEFLLEADYCFIIGANDVVNTSAEVDDKSPIYGMPIIQAYQASRVVIIKRSLGNGYAGIANPLFDENHTRMYLTDAQKGLTSIVDELKID
ncbi:MAG: NAD(P)(+) transhydrogenase (Re/Si-specific) subunit beta [Crocinitomicaceae bacterium]